MIKVAKKIVFALFVSSILAFNGLALTGDHWVAQREKEKKKEPVPEAPKKKEDRGGEKKDDKKKEKKPGDEGY